MRPKTIRCDGCDGAEVPLSETIDIKGTLHHNCAPPGARLPRYHVVRQSDLKKAEPLPEGHPFKDETHLEAHMRLSRELAAARADIDRLWQLLGEKDLIDPSTRRTY